MSYSSADELLILAYHRMGIPLSTARYKGQYVTPNHLRFHVNFLRRLGFRFLPLTQALQATGKRAVITFDDGYRDNLSLGLPLLQKLDVVATVFVVTSDVGKNGVVWKEAGETNPADLMTWQELDQLKKAGWEIGSHCSEHVHLGRRAPDEQRAFIAKSMEDLKSRWETDVFSFAYPYGSFNEVSASLVKECGFICAVSTVSGSQKSASPLYELKRLSMKGYRWDHYIKAAAKVLKRSRN